MPDPRYDDGFRAAMVAAIGECPDSPSDTVTNLVRGPLADPLVLAKLPALSPILRAAAIHFLTCKSVSCRACAEITPEWGDVFLVIRPSLGRPPESG